jgi:hypothetical protein
MTRAHRGSLRRSVALLLLAAAGLTFGACMVMAWTNAVQLAAVTPPFSLALLSADSPEFVPALRPQTPELASPTPSARGPPVS